ncbi:MAG: acetoacetate--CoA ligase [Ramlibacter sp.]|nr:acetoacetate--CoA ligase [Ramlibacter sp.]
MEANTRKLRDWLNASRGLELEDYEALRRWSVEHVEDFWQALWERFELQSPTPHRRVLNEGAGMPGARWFEGAQVNYTGQVLRHVAPSRAAGVPAIVFRNERLHAQGRSEEISWDQLQDRSAALAARLRSLGVERGDRVAAYLPNIPQAVIGFLACASIGAVWTLCATDMGLATVRDRFRQVDPRVLIACDGSVYGGKTADRRELVASLLQELPTLQALVLVPYLEQAGGAGGPFPFDAGGWKGQVLQWDEALAGKERATPEPVPFAHPLWIVYSSGTTGLPKPIVHGHGGVMLEMLKLHAYHLNLQPSAQGEERFHWYSSSGWVMWNLAVSALLLGTTVCVYDGHPSWPAADTLWQFADQVGATFLGAGAAYYTGCMKAGVQPRKSVDVSRLRALGSTGSPLPPQAYTWGYEEVKPDLWWAVIAGGTDLASAFLGGTPELPTVAGEMQARCLGADIHAWNEQGQDVNDDVGELVCLQPMPSMPLFFWGDNDNRRYLDSYFDTYPGVWRHGDWLRITPSGSTVVYGRSDATLNRHGHRMGTSELYRVVEAVPEVLDSLVVDIEYLGRPSFMPLFVVLRPGVTLDAALEAKLRNAIRTELSPRFLPDQIVQVSEVPRTLTGKKQELPVKKLMLGRKLQEVVNKDACANAQAFDWYVAYAQSRETPA